MSFIPLSVPNLKGRELEYVTDCIKTEWVSSVGEYVDRFEEEMAKYFQCKHAIAVTSGTAALQVAMLLAEVEADDEVIVPTLTFIAPINAVKYLGADPIFFDSDEYYNIDCGKVLSFLENSTEMRDGQCINQKTGKRIKAFIPVNVFGNAIELTNVLEACRKRGISVIEDATESLGTKILEGPLAGKRPGAIGDMGCISFNGNKIATCGGGGILLTDNDDYAARARYLTTQAKDDAIQYIHHEVGYNFRLTNVQAALGLAQLEQIETFVDRKNHNFSIYKERLDSIPGLHLKAPPAFARNNCWMYALQVKKDEFGMSRTELMERLGQEKIQCRPVWYLNHKQKPFASCFSDEIDQAEALWELTLNIPCSSNLSDEDRDRVISTIEAIYEKSS